LTRSKHIQRQQQARLQRLIMVVGAYAVVLFAILSIETFGFEPIIKMLWALLITTSAGGNLIFFLLFYSGINLRFPDPSLTWLQISYAGFFFMLILLALPLMRPLILLCSVPVFSFGMLWLNRKACLSLALWVMALYATLLLLEKFWLQPALELKYELFLFAVFGIVLAWLTCLGGIISNIQRQLRTQHKIIQLAKLEIRSESEEREKIHIETSHLSAKLQEAYLKVRTLTNLLPICASCKKIRDDADYWNQLEAYIDRHFEIEFSHGICPDCAKQTMVDMAKYYFTE
jgi:hypothetical protein